MVDYTKFTEQIFLRERNIIRFSNIFDLKNLHDSVEDTFTIMTKSKDYQKRGIEKFTRNSEEIINSGILTGCTDFGLVYAAILRNNNIPVLLVHSIKKEWIQELQEKNAKDVSGVKAHIFLEVFLQDEVVLFDTTNHVIYHEYDEKNLSLPREYYVWTKSADLWSVGQTSYEVIRENVIKYFMHFDISKIKDPVLKETKLK